MSESQQGPWWTPTLDVERLMRWCKAASTITVEINAKVLEGLLHDSLLWRQDRLAKSAEPKLEFSEHCACCVRNKITVDVFSRTAVEPAIGIAPPSQCVCPYVSHVTSLAINPTCPVHGVSEKSAGEIGPFTVKTYTCECMGGCKGQMSLPRNFRCRRRAESDTTHE